VQFKQLRQRGRDATGPARDGYMAVMLAGRAGWNAQQICDFLGVHQHAVETWLQAYRTNGFDALHGLPLPAYRND
jgi:hypothetical protein